MEESRQSLFRIGAIDVDGVSIDFTDKMGSPSLPRKGWMVETQAESNRSRLLLCPRHRWRGGRGFSPQT